MKDNERPDHKQDSDRDTQNLLGYTFVRGPDSPIYKPISDGEDDDRDRYQISPILPLGVKVKRDGFDVSVAVVGWIISVATFVVIATYTYYAGQQWVEMKKAAQASADASNTAALGLQSSQLQFLATLKQMQAQTDSSYTNAGAARSALSPLEKHFPPLSGNSVLENALIFGLVPTPPLSLTKPTEP